MGLERRHVISAGIAGFVSWLLITAALPSLRWIPYAFVAGAVATLSGIIFLIATTSRPIQDVSRPPSRVFPAFITTATWEQEKAALRARSVYTRRKIYSKSPKVSEGVDQLLSFILRDFVTQWYKNISLKPLFQNEIDRSIRDALVSIGDRLGNLDLVEVAVSKIVPVVTKHMQEFYTAERLVRGKNLTRDMTESEELDLAIAGKYRDGRLHKAASLAFSDTKLMQQAHIRTQIGKVLPAVLSENMLSSPAVLTLVREIVSCAVLGPVLSMLSDPDLWNQMIDNFGRALLHERKSVKKLRAALDEHAPASSKGSQSIEVPKLKPNDSERQFERFVRAIRHISTLPVARRVRSEIASQIRRGATKENQDQVYLRRLDAGKRILDQKILAFSNGTTANGRPKLASQTSSTGQENSSRLRQAPLKEILQNASGLSYFMEFMDRRKKMKLVQFWIIIDGFRNPLEEDTDEPGHTLQEQAQYSASDRMDIAQIKNTYLDLPELNVSTTGRKSVETYLKAANKADMQLYINARRAILKAQSAVYDEMREEHFEPFKKSDLFYKLLATEESSTARSEIISPTDIPMRRSMDLPRNSSFDGPRSPALASGSSKPREGDLRRAVMSSTDLSSKAKTPFGTADLARRSIDDNASRPLFEDDIEDERMTRSVPSLAQTESDNESFDASAKVVDAMQKELDGIIDEPDRESLFSDLSVRSPHLPDSPRTSVDTARSPISQGSRPNISSLGLVGGFPTSSVFSEDLFAAEQERYLSDEKEDSDHHEKSIEEDIHEAAPGDLGLKEAIDGLNADVERLSNQEQIVDSLTKKAELTNNAAELRILRKSKQSLQREIRRKELQKQQYIIQESDNSLYGKAAVSIKSIMVGKEGDGHEYAICKTWSTTRLLS